jgi:hypothetical protein
MLLQAELKDGIDSARERAAWCRLLPMARRRACRPEIIVTDRPMYRTRGSKSNPTRLKVYDRRWPVLIHIRGNASALRLHLFDLALSIVIYRERKVCRAVAH